MLAVLPSVFINEYYPRMSSVFTIQAILTVSIVRVKRPRRQFVCFVWNGRKNAQAIRISDFHRSTPETLWTQLLAIRSRLRSDVLDIVSPHDTWSELREAWLGVTASSEGDVIRGAILVVHHGPSPDLQGKMAALGSGLVASSDAARRQLTKQRAFWRGRYVGPSDVLPRRGPAWGCDVKHGPSDSLQAEGEEEGEPHRRSELFSEAEKGLESRRESRLKFPCWESDWRLRLQL